MSARIVLLSTNLAHGGAEAQVAMLGRGLRSRGWEVTVVSLLPPSAFEADLALAGVSVLPLGMRPGHPDARACARLAGILRDLRPRILHSHMFHANLLARAVRLVCPVPVLISTLHSSAESGQGSAGVRRRDWLYRITDPFTDITVAVCQAAADRHAAARAVPRGKLRVIHNGVDTAAFRPDPAAREQTRLSLGIGGEFVWLAAGRLMWKKNYETMLRAFAGQRQAVLLIAGAGPQEAELLGLASDLGVNARFLGHRPDIRELLTAADGFVQSSVIEGLPVALLEASATGLPVVAADTGGVKEVVLDEITGYLVPPRDPSALHAAVKRLMDLPPEARGRMGLRARENAVRHFDCAVTLDRWEQLYREMPERWM